MASMANDSFFSGILSAYYLTMAQTFVSFLGVTYNVLLALRSRRRVVAIGFKGFGRNARV
jgi:hypothetical protein